MKVTIIKWRAVWYLISGASILLSIAFLAMWGLKQGLEFTGGTLMALRFDARPQTVEIEQVLTEAKLDLGTLVIQPVGTTDVQVRMKPITEDQHQQLLASVKKTYPKVTELRFDAIGPVIGQELRDKSIKGLAVALLAIMIYVAYAFRKVSAPVKSWKYGVITIFTAFHDVIVPMGVFAYLGKFHGIEIGTAFIAAILTILGYSITDTIVVLDRVRENLLKRSGSFEDLVEVSVHQTFLRSFNTSVATLLTLFAIFFFGGQSLHDFTLTLIIGITVGTYSSIFIASPMLVSWNKWSKRSS